MVLRKLRKVLFFTLLLVGFANCNKKNNYQLAYSYIRGVDDEIRDIQICLSINGKLDTCYSLYLKSDTNFKQLRKKYQNGPLNLCDIDRVVHPIDGNLVHKTGKLDTSIYNGILRKLYSADIILSGKKQDSLLLKSNILLRNYCNPQYSSYFYPDEKESKVKLDSIYKLHFILSKDTSYSYRNNSWQFCYDLLTIRTIGWMLINPDSMKFLFFSNRHHLDYTFIAYKKDANGFLTRLELLNPSTVLRPNHY